jgi:hypothetical protein
MKCLKSLANPRLHIRQLLQQANRFRNLALLLLALLIATPLAIVATAMTTMMACPTLRTIASSHLIQTSETPMVMESVTGVIPVRLHRSTRCVSRRFGPGFLISPA